MKQTIMVNIWMVYLCVWCGFGFGNLPHSQCIATILFKLKRALFYSALVI